MPSQQEKIVKLEKQFNYLKDLILSIYWNLYRIIFLMSVFTQLPKLLASNLVKNGKHLYLLRHGQSIGEHGGSIVGWTDSRLSIKGRQQSNKLFKHLYSNLDKFTQMHSSDLSRCKDTLTICTGFTSKHINYTTALRQINFGQHQNIHFDSLDEARKEEINSMNYQAPKGQNWIQVKKRALQYLKSLKNGHHLICTHGGLICALTYDLGVKNVIDHCSIISVQMIESELKKVNFHWQFPDS